MLNGAQAIIGNRKRSMRRQPHASWTVYLLRCSDGTLYCGCTNDLARRLVAHSRGGVKYTRGRLPVEVAYHEPARDRSHALRREAALKKLSRSAKLRLQNNAGCTSTAKTLSPRNAD
jgi:putative endonuclease